MGKEDAIVRQYLSEPQRFAQICNNGLFGGQSFIHPEKLKELNPEEIMILGDSLKNHNISPEILKRHRDILKLYDDKALLLLVGIENQEKIHYAMPLRQMQYDVLEYERQWKSLRQKHREQRDLSGSEFLSGISKEDRFIPIVTLCVYWGKEPWDGPKSLHEMLDIPEKLAQYKSIIGNYSLNILEIQAIDDLENYQGELKGLLGFLRYQKEKEALRKFVDENQDIFENLPEETVLAMSVLGDSRELKRCLKNTKGQNDKERKDRKEGINVCDAIREMIEDGREEAVGWINQLNQRLISDERLEDLKRSATDRVYQKQLMKEYGIVK